MKLTNKSIPDWKKAAVVAMYQKYGYRSIGTKLGISWITAKKYVEESQENDGIDMQGVNMRVAE